MKKRNADKLRLKVKRLIIRALFQFDVKPGMSTFAPAMILGLSNVYGNDPKVLADVSGYPVEQCEKTIANCRRAGIWRGETVRSLAWKDANADFAFLLDAMVAEGIIDRAADPKVTERGKQVREAREKAGKCIACGRDRDGEQKTCSRCRASVKASQDRRKRQKGGGAFTPKAQEIEPWYRAKPE